MNWTLQNGWRKTLSRGEERPCAWLRCMRGGFVARDAEGRVLARLLTGGGQARCTLSVQGTVLDVRMRYEAPETTPYYRAPRAVGAEFLKNGQPVRFTQEPNRDFTLSGAVNGTLSGLLGRTARIETDTEDAALVAAVCLLANAMLHADDVDVV